MLSIEKTQQLVSHPERAANSILTVYLNTDQSQQANLNHGFERQLKDMLAAVSHTIQNCEERKAFTIAAEKVEDFLATYRVGARSLAVVYDASDGFFWSEEFDFPVENQVRWSAEVFLQPLAAAIDEYERVGIVLLDRANVRVFTIFLGETEERIRETFDRRKVRHLKTAGMDRLGNAAHAQAKADEQVRTNVRHVIKDIDLMLEDHDVRRIILAGSPEMTSQLHRILPKRLACRIIGTVNVAANASIEAIRKAAIPVAEKFERETEQILVRNLATSAAKSGGG